MDNQPIEISTDADALKAWVSLESKKHPGDVNAQAVREALQTAKIDITPDVEARLEEFVSQCATANESLEPFLIAEGTPPVEGKDGDFEPAVSESDTEGTPEPSDEDKIDYRSFTSVETVAKGTMIGRLIPAVPARSGQNVHGMPIPPFLRGRDVQLGRNVEPDPNDPQQVVATESGCVVYRFGKLDVDDVVHIRGDVDLSTGHVDVDSHIDVRGTVRDLFNVKATRSITIGGALEGADVQAGEDIIIRGGVLGHGQGRASARGHIMVKFCSEAELRAVGDITLAKEAIHSQIYCAGRLLAESGNVIGGHVFARQGGEVRSLGRGVGVATVLSVGIDTDILWKARRLEECIQKLEDTVKLLRKKVKPMMAKEGQLTPPQTEQAANLLSRADQFKEDTEQKRLQQKELLESAYAEDNPRLVIHSTIHPGVLIQYRKHETFFEKEFKGPVRIEARKIKNMTQLVAISTLTGSAVNLPTRRAELKLHEPQPS